MSLSMVLTFGMSTPLLADTPEPVYPDTCSSGLLPRGHLFAPLVGDPHVARLGAGLGLMSSNRALITTGDDRIALGVVALGGSVALYRHSDQDCDGIQISLAGSTVSLFRMHPSYTRLLSTDYRGSLPIEVRSGRVSARLRVAHQSSHLGDGFLLDTRERVAGEVVSYEWLDLTVAADNDLGRVYVGGGIILHSELALEREVLFGGFELSTPARGLSPIAAVHWQTFGDQDWSGTLTVLAGMSIVGERRIDLLFSYMRGANPYSQFFNRESVEIIGVEVRAGL